MNKPSNRLWRDAATVVIAARNLIGGKRSQQRPRKDVFDKGLSENDFDLLMLKRHSDSNFMPSSFVFPGGVIDSADYSEEWIDIFHTQGHSRKDLMNICTLKGHRPPMFDQYKEMQVIPDLAFRICAIREAFEECGVMLFRPEVGNINHDEVIAWRKRVHGDAYSFLDLCRQYNFVPDIWSLKEWSNWLTPVGSKRRFDTMFYICTLESQPQIEYDKKEMSDAIWSSPTELFHDLVAGKLWMPPPQIYEMSRLMQFDSFEEFKMFSSQRELKGSERLLPVPLNLSNGILSLLPGDDCYSTEVNILAEKVKELNEQRAGEIVEEKDVRLQDFKNIGNLNRMKFRSQLDFQIICNNERYGHNCINILSQDILKIKNNTSRL